MRELEYKALYLLRLHFRCPWVLCERSPRAWALNCRPDALGITKDRHMVEIEIKRSMADFRNNAKKYHVERRERLIKKWPRRYYFMVPDKIASKVEKELPEWAGLISVQERLPGGRFIFHEANPLVRKPAPVNSQAARLTPKECFHVAILQSNQLWDRITLDTEVLRDDPEWMI